MISSKKIGAFGGGAAALILVAVASVVLPGPKESAAKTAAVSTEQEKAPERDAWASDMSGSETVNVSAIYDVLGGVFEGQRHKYCEQFGSYVRTMMTSRHEGKTIGRFMEWARTDFGGSEPDAAKEARAYMVRQVYEAPLYSSPDYRERSTADLESRMYMLCYDNFSEISGMSDPRLKGL